MVLLSYIHFNVFINYDILVYRHDDSPVLHDHTKHSKGTGSLGSYNRAGNWDMHDHTFYSGITKDDYKSQNSKG